jgi:hypothetical protein
MPEDSITIKIGHGMCLGAFLFENGDDYEISFDLMDASGNTTNWTDDKIEFTKPEEQTHEE